jgi:glycosyltransferase involved in cell wall biosynthesis
VIVCTRYRAQALERCLDSLGSLNHPSYEVVVVDNTDGDREAGQLAAAAGARYVKEPRVGLSRGRNTGALAAGGDMLAYLDDDAVAEPTWLERLLAALAEPEVMASTGRIIPISPVGSDFAPLLDLGGQARMVNRDTPDWFEAANFGGLGFGGNMAFRRQLFTDGFRFRESLGAGTPLGVAEEAYALFTIIREGHTVAYAPDAVVRHDEPQSAEERDARESAYRRGLAAYLFLLFVEEPEFRRRTARYVLDALRHSPRAWRADQATGRSRLRLLTAACAGPALYLRSRDRGSKEYPAVGSQSAI